MKELRNRAYQLGYAIDYAGMYVKFATLYPCSQGTFGRKSYKVNIEDIPFGIQKLTAILDNLENI